MATEEATLDLKKTVNLPKTKFAQKANLPQTEPARLKKWAEMAEQAQSLEEAAEYGQAIALYEKIMADGSEDASLKSRLEKLQSAWAIKRCWRVLFAFSRAQPIGPP